MTDQDLIGKTVYWVGVGYIARGRVKKTLNIVSPDDTLIVEHLDGYEKTIGASRVHFDPLNAAAEARECADALLDAANQLEKEASE